MAVELHWSHDIIILFHLPFEISCFQLCLWGWDVKSSGFLWLLTLADIGVSFIKVHFALIVNSFAEWAIVHLHQCELVDICLILWLEDQHYLILWLKSSQLAPCSLSNPHPCMVIFFVCDFNIFVATKCSRLIFFFFFFKTLLNFCCNITPVLCFGFFGPEACHTIASQPGTEPTPPALEGKVLTTRPAGKFPQVHLIRSCPSPRISNFSEELWICWLENGIRNQNQGMRFVLASQSLCFLVLSADRMLLNMS